MKKDFNDFLDEISNGYMEDLTMRVGTMLAEKLKDYNGNQAKLTAETIVASNAATLDLLGKYHSWLNDQK